MSEFKYKIEDNVLYVETIELKAKIIKTTEISGIYDPKKPHPDDHKPYYGLTTYYPYNSSTSKYKITPRDMWEIFFLCYLIHQKKPEESSLDFSARNFIPFQGWLNQLEIQEFSEFADCDWTYNPTENVLEYRYIDQFYTVRKTQDKDWEGNILYDMYYVYGNLKDQWTTTYKYCHRFDRELKPLQLRSMLHHLK